MVVGKNIIPESEHPLNGRVVLLDEFDSHWDRSEAEWTRPAKYNSVPCRRVSSMTDRSSAKEGVAGLVDPPVPTTAWIEIG